MTQEAFPASTPAFPQTWPRRGGGGPTPVWQPRQDRKAGAAPFAR